MLHSSSKLPVRHSFAHSIPVTRLAGLQAENDDDSDDDNDINVASHGTISSDEFGVIATKTDTPDDSNIGADRKLIATSGGERGAGLTLRYCCCR